MTSFPMTEISAYLMTDTSYVLFSLLALFQMWTFLKSENHRAVPLVLSAVFTSMAMATRYIGISLILTGVILILMGRSFAVNYRIKCAALYGSISMTLLGIWIVRNWLSVETLRRFDANYESQLLEYIESYGRIFVSFTLALYLGFDWLIYLSFIIICLVIWRRKFPQSIHQLGSFSTPKQRKEYFTLFALYGLYSMIYIAILVAASSRIDHADRLNSRFLTPIYVPVIIITLVLLNLLLKGLARKNLSIPNLITICLISTGILSSVSLSIRWNIDETAQALKLNAKSALFEHHGYSEDMDILTYFRDNPLDGPVYSNGLHLLYWLTDVSLGGNIAEDTENAFCLTWIRRLARSTEPSYIAYFTIEKERLDFMGPFTACNIQELESNSYIQGYLERIVEKSEGIVYRVTAPPGPRPDFDITMDANILTYTKKPCDPADLEPSYFFLHITPVDKNALPNHRSQSGFDNLDFNFEDHGIMLNEECRITVELPHYDISHIRTGQFAKEEGELWEAALSVR